ncbi:MAG: hypothetical protein V2G51_01050 [bacterium JZ-2024 1]
MQEFYRDTPFFGEHFKVLFDRPWLGWLEGAHPFMISDSLSAGFDFEP